MFILVSSCSRSIPGFHSSDLDCAMYHPTWRFANTYVSNTRLHSPISSSFIPKTSPNQRPKQSKTKSMLNTQIKSCIILACVYVYMTCLKSARGWLGMGMEVRMYMVCRRVVLFGVDELDGWTGTGWFEGGKRMLEKLMMGMNSHFQTYCLSPIQRRDSHGADIKLYTSGD